MVIVETYFPRGSVKKDRVINEDKELFGTSSFTNKKKNKKNGTKDTTTEKEEELIHKLSLNNISKDTLIMGCISEINQTELILSLPGRLNGKLPATNISEAYTNMLQKFIDANGILEDFKNISEMFEIGQSVYVKVVEVNNLKNIILSMNPVDLHTNLFHHLIQKGNILNVAISDIEDHGYVIETGIKNLRAFLPKKKIKKQLTIGEIVSCLVKEIEITPQTSIATLSLINISKSELKLSEEPNINHLLPSTLVSFTITKILKNGLQGTINDWSFEVFVTDNHLETSMKTLDDYVENQMFKAYIIYIMPHTKTIYLTLNITKFNTNNLLQIGKVINNAEILNIGYSVNVLLDKTNVGFINLKSKQKENVDMKTIRSNYYEKNTLTVRILDYCMFDRIYLCVDDAKLLNVKHFTINDIKIGEFVEFSIVKIDLELGYYGYVGNIKAKIPKLWLNKKIKDTIIVGSIIHARVIQIHQKKISLTNLDIFLNRNTNVLIDSSNFVQNTIYTGIISAIKDDVYIINFFNNYHGILKEEHIISTYKKSIKIGKTMDFMVKSINSNDSCKIFLSSSCGVINENEYTKVYKGFANFHYDTGINVTIKPDIQENISSIHLTEHTNLIDLMCETYEKDTKFKCIKMNNNKYNIRDQKYYSNNQIKSFDEIQINDILRGSIKHITSNIIEIYCPIKNYNKNITISFNDILFQTNLNINFVPDQIIYLKVEDNKNGILKCTANLSKVWNFNLTETAEYFKGYLKDLRKIHDSQKSKGIPLASFEIGDRITGVVTSIDPNDKSVKVGLHSDIVGEIKLVNSRKKIKIGQAINCFVLWIDFKNKYLDLTMDELMIDEKEENKVDKSIAIGKIALIKDDVIIGKIKTNDKWQLILMPKSVHYNDFLSITEGFLHKNVKEFYVLETYKNFTIGILNNLKEYFEKKLNEGFVDGKDILKQIPTYIGKKFNNYEKKDKSIKKIKRKLSLSGEWKEDPQIKSSPSPKKKKIQYKKKTNKTYQTSLKKIKKTKINA